MAVTRFPSFIVTITFDEMVHWLHKDDMLTYSALHVHVYSCTTCTCVKYYVTTCSQLWYLVNVQCYFKVLEKVKVPKKKVDRETLINVARTSLCTKVTKQVANVLTEVRLPLHTHFLSLSQDYYCYHTDTR